MRLSIAVCTAFILAGCATAGTQVDQSKVAAFQKGVTTYPDVVQALGQPNSITTSDDGTKIIIYTYVKETPRAQDFIPYIGPFIAKADMNSQSYTFTFDKNGLLKTVASGTSQGTASYGLAN